MNDIETQSDSPPCTAGSVVVEFENDLSVNSSSSAGTGRLTNRELRKNRAFITILHYCLMYPRWSFSLFLLLASRSVPLPVARESVRQPAADLRAVARDEATLYYECAVDTFSKIQHNLQATAKERKNLLDEKQVENSKFVANAERIAERAVNRTKSARRVLQLVAEQRLQQHQEDANNSLPFLKSGNGSDNACTPQDQINLTHWLGLDHNQTVNATAQDSIVQVLDAYLEGSQSTLRHVTNYAQNRSTYDYHYFVGIKIQATLDALDLEQPPHLQLSFDQTALLKRLKLLLQAIVDALRDAYVRISILTLRVQDFHASLVQFHAEYLNLYARLRQASLWVRDFLPAGRSLPAFLDMQGISQADLLLPDVFSIPSFPTPLPDIDTMIAEYIQEVLQLLAQLVAELVQQATEQTKRALQILLEKLRELLTLEDYDPPRYSGLERENDNLEKQAKETKQMTADALTQMKESKVSVEEQELPIPTDEPIPPFSSALGSNSTASFEYLEPRLPYFSIPEFLESLFVFLLANQWLIEVVIQLVRFVQLRRKYERNAHPDVPAVDYQVDDPDEEDGKESRNTVAITLLALLKSAAVPWLMAGLFALPFAFVIVFAWFPYVKAKCFHSQEGTFVARSLVAPILINEANFAGYNHHIGAELECQRTQRRYCQEIYADAAIIHRRHSFALEAAQERFNESLASTGLAQRCVQADQIDQLMSSSCCGLEGYISYACLPDQQEELCPIDERDDPSRAFRPLQNYLKDDVFEVGTSSSSWKLPLQEEGCTEEDMEVCRQVPCKGVDADLILDMAVDADCRIESYVILCCIYVLVAVYYAFMCSVSCALAFEGVKCLVWRRLRPAGIRFQTHVNEDGHLVQGGNTEERTERIARAMKRFERKGRMQLALSAIVLLTWFTSFWIIRHLVAGFSQYL